MIKSIVFDIGGVIVGSFGKELLEEASAMLLINSEELRKLMNKHEPELQKGKLWHVDFWKKICEEKSIRLPDDKILERLWLNSYEKKAIINDEMVSLIKNLRKNYLVGCISNIQEPHVTFNKKRGLFDLFQIRILSCEIGFRKPEKEIFLEYIKNANCKAHEIIFIDDEADKLETPKLLGITTIHFLNTTKLKEELTKQGVILN